MRAADPIDAIARHRVQLQTAMDTLGRTHTISDLLVLAAENRIQIWESPNQKALVVTEVQTSRGGTSVNIWLAAGRMEDVVIVTRFIERQCRQAGVVKSIHFTGRKGWARAKEPIEEGWTQVGVVFSKVLKED